MILHRPSNTRGHLKNHWIESRRTFSNNSYCNPKYMNWGDLLVINDDIVQPGNFVPWHEHKNTEILGYIVQGPCYHKDSLGNFGEADTNWVQRMSSGKGIEHTEGNNSDHPIRYLQLWISPSIENTKAEYTKQYFSPEQRKNNFCPIAGPKGPIIIRQDAYVSTGIFTENYEYILSQSRIYYVYAINGNVTINGQEIHPGDGLSIKHESDLIITNANCELLLFDLNYKSV